MNKDLKTQLDKAAKDLAQAKALEDEAKAIKNSIKQDIKPLMMSFEVKSHKVEGLGIIGYRTGGGSGINKTKLTENLLTEGIEADRVADIIERSTKSWSYDYVEFKEG